MLIQNVRVVGRCLVVIGIFCNSFLSFSQEICNNGIDDDNNGLIDLNDTLGCQCNLQASQVPSLFPNPSFEDFIVCPFSFSQIQVLTGNWTNGTDGTTDYLNTCGYSLNAQTAGLIPFPDGNGVVGGFYSNVYKEYIGACLNSPLLPGKTYILRFNIASTLVSNTPDQPCPDLQEGALDPVNVTLFGAVSCSSLPSPTSLCPTVGDAAWEAIGMVTYTPTQAWSEVQMTFTPTSTISSVMLGPPCTLPASFPDSSSTECLPYFYYDNLILNDSTEFESAPGLISGNICEKQPTLEALFLEPNLEGGTYQWYKNGIALVGETDSTYTVSAGTNGFGVYQAAITNGNGCGITDLFIINSIPPTASFTGLSDSIYVKGETVQLTSTSLFANELIWEWCNDSISSAQTISLLFKDTGSCCMQLAVSQGECSDTVEKCVHVVPFETPEIPNVFTPNSDAVNDVFKVNTKGVKNLSCTIFNRWGTPIYKWENDINGFWNGEIENTPAASGTYFYLVNYTNFSNQSIASKGNITLLRD